MLGDIGRDDVGAVPARLPGRPRRLLVIPAVLLVLVAVIGGALGLGGGGSDDDPGPASNVMGPTAVVERGTLSDSVTLDGRIGYGTARPLRIRATGTITWLPPAGRVVRRGEPLLRVDDRPVTLMYGDLPMYRPLGLRPASTAPETRRSDSGASPGPAVPASRPLTGRDVDQFESNLRDLGYTGFTVDDEFTVPSAAAVKRWQRDLKVTANGRVGVGDVAYAPGAVRFAGGAIRTGDDVGEGGYLITGTRRVITVQASLSDSGWARPGNRVTVTFPNGTRTPGRVSDVGDVATAHPEGDDPGQDGAEVEGDPGATVPVTVSVADQSGLGGLRDAPVQVSYTSSQVRDVLSVPVAALVALAEGGYGLEAVGGGSSHYVAVTPGTFAEGRVQVSGAAVREGLVVRIPE